MFKYTTLVIIIIYAAFTGIVTVTPVPIFLDFA